MSYIIPIGGWVNFSGGGGGGRWNSGGVVKKSQSRDIRSLEVGISANCHLVKPQPDQHSGSLNTCNWEESAAFVMTSANG